MLYKIFISDWIVPKKADALTLGCFIFIRSKYVNDIGLIEHEKVHVKQFWKNPIWYHISYLLLKKYRFMYEVEAYRKELLYYPQSLHLFANKLATDYKLNITEDEALEALARV